MRTIKQYSYPLTNDKWEKLFSYASLYAKEKDRWLLYLHSNIGMTKDFRAIRQEFVDKKHGEVNKLPSFLWKTALDSACKQMDMYWQALFVEVRKNVSKNASLATDQKKHCYMVLRNYPLLDLLMQDKNPESKTALSYNERLKANRYLARTIKKKSKGLPRVKLVRSYTLDSGVARKFERDNAQFVSLPTLTKGKRVVIPLKGNLHFCKNIDVVLNAEKQSIAIHYSVKTKDTPKTAEQAIAINTGYTEVFVDSNGKSYGRNFGEIMTQETEVRHKRGIARNKLFQLAKKYEERGDIKKARNIRRNNLGRKKLEKKTRQKQEHLENKINEAINSLKTRYAGDLEVVCEKMGNSFTKTTSKSANRKLSAWVRGVIKERLQFKVNQGYKLTELNPAYISMTCPECGYVDPRNKTKDNTFECGNCGCSTQIDWVAAKNILSRLGDSEITEYTPVKEVKKILTDRFVATVGR